MQRKGNRKGLGPFKKLTIKTYLKEIEVGLRGGVQQGLALRSIKKMHF